MSSLDSCCAPCVTTPPVNIPGSAGLNAYTNTTESFTLPAVGGQVFVTVANTAPFAVRTNVAISDGSGNLGTFIIGQILGDTLSLTFLGLPTDQSPGTTISINAVVVETGFPGRNAFTSSTGLTVVTLVGGTFTIPVKDSAWAAIGQTIFASDGTNKASFTVTSTALNQITGTFLGLTGDSVPTFTIGIGAIVTPAANPNTTYPVAIANGGTNATTAAQARTNLGAAASGANTDITSLANLSTPITLAQGGTGQTTAFTSLQALITAGKVGTFVANGVTPVSVTNTAVTSGSVIIVTLKTVGGTVGAVPAVKTITPGAGFTIAGTASDTSTYNFVIIN